MMPIDKRKSIRLKEYDYAQEGDYFITICTKDRKCILSEINDCRGVHCTSVLSTKGKIVEKYIKEIENKYKNVEMDEYIIMPNHIHMILIIKDKRNNTISKIIQQFKGAITKEIKEEIWQKLFYERVIRNEKEYLLIKEYIINNPANWKKDKYY